MPGYHGGVPRDLLSDHAMMISRAVILGMSIRAQDHTAKIATTLSAFGQTSQTGHSNP